LIEAAVVDRLWPAPAREIRPDERPLWSLELAEMATGLSRRLLSTGRRFDPSAAHL